MEVRIQPTAKKTLLTSSFAILVFFLARVLNGQVPAESAQNETPSQPSSFLLSQALGAFSGGQTIHTLQISGNATWYSGSEEDHGTASLTASDNGQATLQLQLQNLGSKIESQTGIGSNAKCSWSGSNGVVHQSPSASCWIPLIWFFPTFSLQPSVLASNVNFSDLGSGAVGSEPNIYRHARLQLSSGETTNPIPPDVAAQTAVDIGFTPQTMLPAVLSYSLVPDSGTRVSIPVQIVYANYQLVNGIEVPFLIERYVNGNLQLEIQVSTVSVN